MQYSRTSLDETDTQLLAALQHNAYLTAQELGEVLNLSPSQVGRRRQRLESEGLITGYCARLDPALLGLCIQAFVQVQLADHGPDSQAEFSRFIAARPEITNAWALTGEADFLLRIYCEDLPVLNRLIRQVLLAHRAVARAQCQIVMDQLKSDAPLPISILMP